MNRTVFSCFPKVRSYGTTFPGTPPWGGCSMILGPLLKRHLLVYLPGELLWLVRGSRGTLPMIFVPGQEHMEEAILQILWSQVMYVVVLLHFKHSVVHCGTSAESQQSQLAHFFLLWQPFLAPDLWAEGKRGKQGRSTVLTQMNLWIQLCINNPSSRLLRYAAIVISL